MALGNATHGNKAHLKAALFSNFETQLNQRSACNLELVGVKFQSYIEVLLSSVLLSCVRLPTYTQRSILPRIEQ